MAHKRCGRYAPRAPRLAGGHRPRGGPPRTPGEREFFIDNLLVRIHFIIEMIWWTGLAPWKFEFPFPGSLTSTFLERLEQLYSRAADGQPRLG